MLHLNLLKRLENIIVKCRKDLENCLYAASVMEIRYLDLYVIHLNMQRGNNLEIWVIFHSLLLL